MANKIHLPLAAMAGTAAVDIGIGAGIARSRRRRGIDGRGQTVLVTGASSGLGREFAREFAAHGSISS